MNDLLCLEPEPADLVELATRINSEHRASHAAHPIEFLLERALKYQPDDREKKRINEKASPNRMAPAAEVSGTPRND